MVFLTLLAARITADNTKRAPKLAAIGKDQFDSDDETKNPPNTEEPNIKSATPKLAPEETPNTNGPASGFRNKVCINNPHIDKPEPTKTAVIAFGILKLSRIIVQLSLLVAFLVKKEKISSTGIETEPRLMFTKNKTISKTDKLRKCFV